MANSEQTSAAELRDFLSGQVQRLTLLKRILVGLIILVFLALVGHMIYYFNMLTSMHYDVVTAESQVDSAVQYRVNLVPILVRSVTRFVDHEDYVFIKTVDARERSMRTPDALAKQLKSAAGKPVQEVLDKILAIAEQYPALTTSGTFQLMMTQVANAEAQVLAQRIDYNDKVNLYTTAMSVFPGNVYSKLFNFCVFEYFDGTRKSEWPLPAIQADREAINGGIDGKR
jgi:LemA protein